MIRGDNVAELGPRNLPLEGIEVLEVGGSLPGRLLAKLLTDQGASARHVDLIGNASAPYDFDRAGPPQLLDLTASSGKGELQQLAAHADIVIDGLPGVGLESFDLGFAELSRDHDQLLFCHLSAMPAEAEGDLNGEYAEWLIAGQLGLHHAGVAPPEREPLSLVSAYGALQAAMYLAAGLIQRERRGVGSEIDVSLFGAAIMALNRRLLKVADPRFRDPLGTYRLPIAERYKCADGRYLQSQGAVDSVASSVIRAMGHPEWVEEAISGLTAFETEDEQTLWRGRFSEIYASKGALEWESAVAAEGGAGALCRTREEWKSEEHARSAEIFVANDDGDVLVGPGVRLFAPSFAGSEPAANTWPASESDERLPLAGLRVIDLAIILAGPTCGRLLGELGADVIKIDAPDRTDLPWVSPYGWLDVNRTKRSVLLDLKTEEGREVLWRLIEDADVLVENYRAGKIADLGFSFENVAKRNPRIVHVSMNAYDFGGTFAERPGWEQNAQAMTGMQAARAKNGFPRQVLVPLNDFGTGYLGAYGTLLGIYSARKTGRAQRVLGSLSRTGSYLQTVEYSQSAPIDRGDDVVFLETGGETIGISGSLLEEGVLRDLVGDKDAPAAIAALEAAGYVAGPARTPEGLLSLEWVRKAGLIANWDHPKWGEMTNVFAHADATSFEQRRGWPSQNPGQETTKVLREAGYSQAEIAELIERRVAFEEVSLFRSV